MRINGVKLAPMADQAQWFAADVPPRVMRRGPNELAITFERGRSASWALTVRSVELSVQYAGQ